MRQLVLMLLWICLLTSASSLLHIAMKSGDGFFKIIASANYVFGIALLFFYVWEEIRHTYEE